jgi:membrane protease YdiL (CAAX protease family)
MLLLYWILAFAIAWAITVPIALQTHHMADFGLPPQAVFLIGFAPAIAAFIAAAFGRELRALVRRIIRIRAPLWTYVLALALPAVLLGAPFLAAQVMGTAPPKVALDAGVLPFVGIWFVLALGEEIGWRGYALPKLMEKLGFWVSATILGVVWCIWHYPRNLGSPYLDFSQMDVVLQGLGLFSLQIFLANYLICWLFEKSGRAVLVPTLFHTAFNTVATVYMMAAMDPYVTAVMAALVVLVALFDRRPGAKGEMS